MARIEHRVGVAAPASAVWSVVSDLGRWAEWNPVYPEASGKLSIGSPLKFKLVLPDRDPMMLDATLVDWVPNEQLVWKIKLMGGLLRLTRYVEIEALNENACILSNGELQEGLGARFVPARLRRAVRDAMQAMNEAAKARAESLAGGGSAEGAALAQLSEAG